MNKLTFTSLGSLLIAAITAAGGIVLLDVFYLRQQVEGHKSAAVQERVKRVKQVVQASLDAEQDILLRTARLCAQMPETRGGLRADGSPSPLGSPPRPDASGWGPLFSDCNVEVMQLTDASGRTTAYWSRSGPGQQGATPSEQSLQKMPTVRPSDAPMPRRQAALVRLRDGVAVSCSTDVYDDRGPQSRGIGFGVPTPPHAVLGRLWLARRLDADVLRKIASPVDAELEFVLGDAGPLGPPAGTGAFHSLQLNDNEEALATWPALDPSGQTLGFWRARASISEISRQAVSARRTLLIILSLSLGLTLLVITGMHILITGPVVRLLNRLREVEAGVRGPEQLSRDLHGEPRMLARQLEDAFKRLTLMAITDQLTGLANRRHFEQVLDAFYHQARRYNRQLSILAIDIDFFKAINDTGGHQVGDEVLRTVGRALEGLCRKADLPARIGGDEFCVILPETCASGAAIVAERIREMISAQEIQAGPKKITATVSIGVTDLNSGEINSPDALMAMADEALYAAKKLGANRVFQAHDVGGPDRSLGSQDNLRFASLAKKAACLDTRFKDAFLAGVEELMNVMAQRDSCKAHHSRNISRYAVLIAQEMGLTPRVTKRLEIAAMLHDIGMLALPDDVLKCPGPLNPEQTAQVRQHPLLGVRIMEGMEFLEQEIPTVRYHHERYDGGGYPEGLTGAAIPLTARILAAADSFDAMTSPRSFRNAKSLQEALAELEKASARQFDPLVIEAFKAVADRLGEEMLPEAVHQPLAL